jgi:indole-3-glycerol phosphate synthase
MSVLPGILAGVHEDLEERKAKTTLAELKSRISDMPAALDPLPRFRQPELSIIAEVKRSSPSKGALAEIPDPAALAEVYEAAGAGAISVLTERRKFRGSLADLEAVRARVTIPVLRKDFITDPYQLWEARAFGADLALLMVVSLSDTQLEDLMALCGELGLTPLVESHNEAEVERAVASGATLLGINARDLTTLQVDRATFGRLAPLIPDDRIVVGESGITAADHVAEYRNHGADVVLIGEALVVSPDPKLTIAEYTRAGCTKNVS